MQDLVAQVYALVTNINARPRDEVDDLLAPFATKRTAQVFAVFSKNGHWEMVSDSAVNLKVILFPDESGGRTLLYARKNAGIASGERALLVTC
jgi:hypothetical protein